MFHSTSHERRHHKRFLVEGRAKFRIPPEDFTEESAEVVNVGGGGILVLSSAPPPIGSAVEVMFTIDGYRGELSAKGRVARHAPGVLAIEFSESRGDMEDLVGWLEAGLVATLLPVRKK